MTEFLTSSRSKDQHRPDNRPTLAELLTGIPRALIRFRRRHGYFPNILRPKTFSEHIVAKRLFDRNPLLTTLADKYAVREYVAARVGPKYLTKLFHVTEEPDTIDWDGLPASFVVKATHGCRYNLLVPDKAALDIPHALELCRTWLGQNYYRVGQEWAYKHIRPRIIVEEYLSVDAAKRIPDDYKVWCFGGKPVYLHVDYDRYGDHRRNLYTTGWKKLPVRLIYENVDGELPPPANLDEILWVAAELAAGLDFIRVDVYNVNGRIVFGEMTNYPGNGLARFYPAEYDRVFGEQWPE